MSFVVAEVEPNWASAMSAIATLVAASVAAITFIVLLVTALIFNDQLRDARRTRHGQLVTDLSRRWDETFVAVQPTMIRFTKDDLRELTERVVGGTAQVGDEASYFSLMRVPDLMETIGVIEADGAITLRVVYLMWGDAIRLAWRQFEPTIRVIRGPDSSSARVYASFEGLAAKLEGPIWEAPRWNDVVRSRLDPP